MKITRFFKSAVSVILLSGLLSSVFACAPAGVSAEDLMKDVTPSAGITQTTDKKITETVDFAVKLMQTAEGEGKNTLLSPLSVLAALAMTQNGAEGNTLSEMENTFGTDREGLNGFLSEYLRTLPGGDNYKINVANSIWFTNDSRFTVKADFLQKNADTYGADIFKAPFDKTTLRDINNWVEEETDGMIKNILDRIPSDAIMYLVNALAFEAEWMDMYQKHQVKKGDFHSADGSIQKAEFMNGAEGKYLSDGDAEGFVKYYSGGKYAFAALLPREGLSLSDYIASLDGERLLKTLGEAEYTTVHSSIPKFEVEYGCEMAGILGNMGIKDAFDSYKADFSGLGSSTGGNIFISRVIHKTYISVAEQGTRAGAATIVEMSDGASPEMIEPKEVCLDRPFLYMIIDCETNIPIFMGTLNSVK